MSLTVTDDFDWPEPTVEGLAERLDAAFHRLSAEPGQWRGEVEWKGPPRVQKPLATPAELGTTTPDSFSFDYSSPERRHCLHVYGNLVDGTLRVRLDIPDSDLQRATSILTDLREELQLVPQGDYKDLRSAEHSFELPPRLTPQWVKATLVRLHASVSSRRADFGGSYSSRQGTRYAVPDEETWLQEIEKRWDDLEDLQCWVRSRRLAIHLRVLFETGELRLEADAPTLKDGKAVLQELQADLSLTPSASRDHEREGERRVFFTEHPLDIEWFRHMEELLTSLVPVYSFFEGRIERRTLTKEDVLGELGTWLDHVKTDWQKIAVSSCYVSARQLQLRLRVDHFREAVELEVMSTTKQEVRETVTRLAADLMLRPATGQEYKQPLSKGSFRVEGWTAERFAKAVDHAVTNYVGERNVVVEALIFEGAAHQAGMSFGSVDAFLGQVRTSERLVGASLVVEGPRGAALGVHLSKRRVLEIRSSLPGKEFPELLKFFRPLGLRDLEEAPSAESESRSKSLFDTATAKALTLLLTLVLGGGLWEWLRPMIPRYELEVTSPRETEPLPVGTPVRIEWRLAKEQYTNKIYVEPEPAQVRILRAGGSEYQASSLREPGWEVELPPGRYEVEVTSIDGKLRATSEVTIEEVAVDPEDAAKAKVLWKKNWLTINEPLPSMGSSEGYSATNRRRLLGVLTSLELSTTPSLSELRESLVRQIKSLPAQPGQNTYDLRITPEMESQLATLRRGIRDQAISVGVPVSQPL